MLKHPNLKQIGEIKISNISSCWDILYQEIIRNKYIIDFLPVTDPLTNITIFGFIKQYSVNNHNEKVTSPKAHGYILLTFNNTSASEFRRSNQPTG
jgi:hypothetical protein